MLDIIMVSSFVILGAYSLWFFFKAKTYQPLGLDELALMWKTHKQKADCKASRIDTLLLNNNQVVGYKCDCGNNYYQKRLITQKAHTFTKTKLIPSVAKGFTGVLDIESSMRKADLNYAHLKQI